MTKTACTADRNKILRRKFGCFLNKSDTYYMVSEVKDRS